MTEPPQHPAGRGRHLYDEGATTVDLKGTRYTATVPAPKPSESDQSSAEHITRTRGRWLIISGVVIALLSTALAEVWAAGFDDDMPLGLLLPLQAAGFGAIAIGCLEFLNRPARRAQRLMHARLDNVELAIMELVGLMAEDKQQQFYQGAAWQIRNELRTGTENARGLNRYRTGDVLTFRPRNGS